MVIDIGKVCVVHQHPCVVVPAYLPTVDVLDHDVVWWLTKFFCKIVTASVAFLHTFFFLNRKQLLWLNRKKKLHNFIYFSRVRKTCFTSTKFRGFENKQTIFFFTSLRVLCFSRVHTGGMGQEGVILGQEPISHPDWVLYLHVAILPYFFFF